MKVDNYTTFTQFTSNLTRKSRNKNRSYKYCIVPMCTNTSKNTPDKIFFAVPRNAEVRTEWCKAMKRDVVKLRQLSSKSCLQCCEDHFNLEEDTVNYIQYQIMHVQHGNDVGLRLKKGVIPHLFHCQNKKVIKRMMAGVKRKLKKSLTTQSISKLEEREPREFHCIYIKQEALETEESLSATANKVKKEKKLRLSLRDAVCKGDNSLDVFSEKIEKEFDVFKEVEVKIDSVDYEMNLENVHLVADIVIKEEREELYKDLDTKKELTEEDSEIIQESDDNQHLETDIVIKQEKEDLYKDHIVKDELVIGPEIIRTTKTEQLIIENKLKKKFKQM